MKSSWLCLVMLIALAQVSLAQSGLEVGKNILGELSYEQPVLTYPLNTPDETPLTLEAQSLTSDFAPMLMLYNGDGQLLLQEKNPLAATKIRLTFTPAADETYSVRVWGVEGGVGQFILSLNSGLVPLPPANELRLDMSIEDRVTLAAPVIRFQLAADRRQATVLSITSLLPKGGMGAYLTDLEGDLRGVLRHDLGGGAFVIPAAVDVNYELWIIHSGVDQLEGFTVSLKPLAAATAETTPEATRAATQSVSATPETSQVIIPFDGPCAVTSASSDGVNIRRGPATEYGVVSGLTEGEILAVTGRDQSAKWWQVEYETGLYGWVVDTAVRRGGDCTDIGFVLPPPLPVSPTEEVVIPTPTTEGN